MSYLKSLLNAFASKVGLPKHDGYVVYDLPQRGTDKDETSVQQTAPFDGYAQVCAWFSYGCSITNDSIKSTDSGLASGKSWGGSTAPSDTRAFVPVRKGDSVTVQLSIQQGQIASGKIVFFKRFGS